MNNRFESEELDSLEFNFEIEEERRGPRRRRTASRRPSVRRKPALRSRAAFRRKPPIRKRPRPRGKFPIRFPVRPLSVAVFPDQPPYPLPPKDSGSNTPSQSSPADSGPSGTPNEPPDNGQTAGGSEFIAWAQASLNKVLNLNLRTDGVIDADTRAAIRSFQQREKLPVTGRVGPDTQQALITATQNSATTAQDSDGDKAEEFYFESEPFELEFDSEEEFYDSEFDDYDIEESLFREAESEFELQDEFGFAAESEEWEEEISRSSGDYIRWVQGSLNRIMGLRLAVDGVAGPQTRSAIRSFQQRQGLLADGIVGSQTEAALIAAGAGRPPATSTAPAPSVPTGSLDIVNVRGIQVARQIAPQVDAMLAAAQADGIRFGGGGFRSPQAQIDLRRKHCGPTHYDIYEKPSSQCKPPTARPGQSNHERGLAIDFTYNGSSIKSHDNPGFRWLAANAARFGLYNLPSEPWHWSVNGK